jgi:hypothetical protein
MSASFTFQASRSHCICFVAPNRGGKPQLHGPTPRTYSNLDS